MNAEQQRAIATAEQVLGVPLQHVTALSGDDRRNLILRAFTPPRSVVIKPTRDTDYRPQAAEALEAGLVREWVATAFERGDMGKHKIAKLVGVGSGTVARIKAEIEAAKAWRGEKTDLSF